MFKIHTQTEIKTFPYINRIACKGWAISDGTFAWSMYTLKCFPSDKISSDIRVRGCLLKSVKLMYNIYNGNDFIEIENGIKP